MWYVEISEYLINLGCIDVIFEWVKWNLKKIYFGCEEVIYIDFIIGEKIIIWEFWYIFDFDIGEMYIFLIKVEVWCVQFGLVFIILYGCEYQ